MKYIFDCSPDDFSLAGRSIKSALPTFEKDPDEKFACVFWENGEGFTVIKNKKSYRVVKH